MRDVVIALENIHINGDSNMTIKISYQYSIIPKGMDMLISNLDIDKDNNEHCDEGHHQVEQISDENEFGGTEFENLVLLEGLQ